MKRYTEKTLREYIREHSKWGPKQREERLCFFALAMCGETGELANFVKKAWRGDFGSLKKGLATLQPKLVSEAADVGAYAMMFLDLLSGGQLGPEVFKKFLEVEARPKYKAAEAKRAGATSVKPMMRAAGGLGVIRAGTWKESVSRWIGSMRRLGCKEFELDLIYKAGKSLSNTHPQNKWVEAKLRQVLQELINAGEVTRVERGLYHIVGGE